VTALGIVLATLCALWFVQAALTITHLIEIRTLARLSPPEPRSWPRVSTIVPARNEARSIAAALETRLTDDYPDLELVVVDDRSNDETPRIVATLAGRDRRLRVIRLDELPEGWLGKLNALEHGVREATGPWLLISDADIHLERGTLRRAVAHCEAEGLDFLALVPEFRSRSIAVNVLWSTFIRVLAMALSPAGVRNPRSKVAAGSGSFMLVRRSVYSASPGFEHLRMETGDDMAFGAMIKRAGGRCDFMNGRDAAWLPSYASIREFYAGVEKNGGTFAGTPFPLVLAVIVAAGILEYSPLLALGVGYATDTGWLALLGGLTTVVATGTACAACQVNTGGIAPALLWPLGWLGMASGVARAALLARKRGGVDWRGTFYFYTTEQLDHGRRFKLF